MEHNNSEINIRIWHYGNTWEVGLYLPNIYKIWLIYALRPYINKAVFENFLSRTEKIIKTFIIPNKIFKKNDILLCVLKAHVNKIYIYIMRLIELRGPTRALLFWVKEHGPSTKCPIKNQSKRLSKESFALNRKNWPNKTTWLNNFTVWIDKVIQPSVSEVESSWAYHQIARKVFFSIQLACWWSRLSFQH